MSTNYQPQVLGLMNKSSNEEIIVARNGVEIAFSALSRVLTDDDKKSAVVQDILDTIDSEVHWSSSTLDTVSRIRLIYQNLAELHQQEISDPFLNPSLLNPDQAPALLETTRTQNIDFVNRALHLPEVATIYKAISPAEPTETEVDLDEHQIDTIAIDALVASLTSV